MDHTLTKEELFPFVKETDAARLKLIKILINQGKDPDVIFDNMGKKLLKHYNELKYIKESERILKSECNNRKGLSLYKELYPKFVEFYDKLYDGPILEFALKVVERKFEELPLIVLQEFKQLLQLMIEVDMVHMSITANFKSIASINSERIKKEKNISAQSYSMSLLQSHEPFSIEYKRLYSAYLLESNSDKKAELFKKLTALYHLGSSTLSEERLKQDFGDGFVPLPAMYKQKSEVDGMDPELRAIVDIIDFDNYYEFVHVKRFGGIAGITLRDYLFKVLEKHNFLSPDNSILSPLVEKQMLKLLDGRISKVEQKFVLHGMKSYIQTTAITCAPSCFMMVDNYLLGKQMDRKRELALYNECTDGGNEGINDPLLAVMAKREGLTAKVLHSNPAVFGNLNEVPQSIVDELAAVFKNVSRDRLNQLVEQYLKSIKLAETEGVETRLADVNTKTFIEQLKNGYIPIPLIMLGNEQHDVVIFGYDSTGYDTCFYVMDPIRGRLRISEQQLNSEINPPGGAAAVFIGNYLPHIVIESAVQDAVNGIRSFEEELNLADLVKNNL